MARHCTALQSRWQARCRGGLCAVASVCEMRACHMRALSDVSTLAQGMKASLKAMPCCPPQMVMETKSSLESGIIGSGHSFAAARLDAQRGAGGWVQEQMSGLAYLEHIRSLAARVDSDWPGVQSDLESIRYARSYPTIG